MQITIDIPDAKVGRVRDAFCSEFSYLDMVDDGEGNQIPNPQTKNQFTKQQIIKYIKQVTANYEANLAAGVARNTATADVGSISIT